MSASLFDEFLVSEDTLRVFNKDGLIFKSNKDYLIPLLEYIDNFNASHGKVVIFDRVTGNAAALLAVKAGCEKVYSPLGSELAIHTLVNYGIKYYFAETVPYIRNRNGEAMCPMEKLSLNKNPEEFCEALRSQRKGNYQ